MIATTQSQLCPLCQTDDVRLVKSIPREQLCSEWASDFSIDIESQLHDVDQIKLFQCNRSSLRFFSPINVAGNSEFYRQLSNFPWYYNPRKWEHDVAIPDIGPQAKVLEIGCGEGAFVRRLNSEHNISAIGIELNETAARFARQQGIPVQAISVEKMAATHAEQFDVVCAFQVLEHIPNPHRFLSSAIDLLRPGGTLVICVPNHDSYLQHQWNLLDMPPHHMTQWTARSLKALERVFPVKLSTVKMEPLASYHVRPFVSTYARHFGRRSLLHKLAFNGLTKLAMRGILYAGVRRFARGQSIYVEFTKSPTTESLHRRNR
ncbi:MAG: class I SAM-dependent methyltransferase [Planctomycetes bacterium]|nr:class I SAM-dependent methyltransferase [Planctomycetota bacterium]